MRFSIILLVATVALLQNAQAQSNHPIVKGLKSGGRLVAVPLSSDGILPIVYDSSVFNRNGINENALVLPNNLGVVSFLYNKATKASPSTEQSVATADETPESTEEITAEPSEEPTTEPTVEPTPEETPEPAAAPTLLSPYPVFLSPYPLSSASKLPTSTRRIYAQPLVSTKQLAQPLPPLSSPIHILSPQRTFPAPVLTPQQFYPIRVLPAPNSYPTRLLPVPHSYPVHVAPVQQSSYPLRYIVPQQLPYPLRVAPPQQSFVF